MIQLQHKSSTFSSTSRCRAIGKSLKSSIFIKTSLLTFFHFQFIISTAQINQPKIPTTTSFQPVNINNNNTPKYYQPNTNNNPNTTNYANPHNNQSNKTQQITELENLKKENKLTNTIKKQFSFPSNANKKGTKEYYQAYEVLAKMLDQNENLDIKKALFTVENAYFENKYKYEDFDKRIKAFTTFCQYKMKEESTNTHDNKALNEILFRLMSDTLSIINPKDKQKLTHYPVQYNFNDFYGMEDWSNMFVMKLVYNNFGQCHSMPLLYKILAKEIGAECYLSTSPNHLYIKYKSGNQWKNVELTNGHYTSDAYVIGSGYIKSEAIKNKTYLDTLSDLKTISLLMQDLAKGYYIKFGMDEFVLKCTNKGLQYYPNDAYGMAIKSDYYTMLMQYIVQQSGLQSINEILKIPQAKEVFTAMNNMYSQIDNAGITQMPEQPYEQVFWNTHQEKKCVKYKCNKHYNISVKFTIYI
jgi:hypothetical protein